MKKLFIAALTFFLLCSGCAKSAPAAPPAAPAQTPQATPVQTAEPTPLPVSIPTPVRVEAGGSKSIDLNGDGREETVSILVSENDPGAEEDETLYYFIVADANGTELLRQCSETLTYSAYAYAADIDKDGRAELFFCQTFMSDDLITKCYRCEGDTFRGLCFLESDCDTCVSDCYGLIEGFGENSVRVSSHVNVLGTRGGLRDYVLDGDVFVPAPDSLWDFTSTYPSDDPDTWEFYTLETSKPLPVTIDGKPDTLPVSTKLIITGTDAKDVAEFLTKEGVKGSFAIQEDASGWGWMIAGEPEQDWFKGDLPYAG